MTQWLEIVGMPEAGPDALSPQARALVERARTIVGVSRRLAGLAGAKRTLVAWDGDLTDMVGRIIGYRGSPTVLLASGDPNWFGIGATLGRYLEPEEFGLHPAPSSFQLAAARLHWPMQNTVTLSLHGRPVAALHPHVLPGNRVLALTSDARTLIDAADLLCRRGYGKSRLTILENLGGADERLSSGTADAADTFATGDFFVLGIDCVADAGAPLLPPVPGLDDAAFETDGQLTKREVRAATLARLAPYPGALLWDVGAGSGAIAIEWMRAARDARAIAFERDMSRCALISRNRVALGVPGLELVPGEAPQSLVDQPRPDALFLGGDVANPALFEACWQALKPVGRLVANGVTLDAEAALFARQARLGGELTRISVETLDRIGGERVLRPRLAVTQWTVTKEGE
ncbi:MAG: precorrin-6y C5,15-methyltransferase (decarboxylating) subunit CbiE [Alphaproteobacteria bacterium]|nr:precorrin-6y C5,15-methyltransferase (decarboxylating) subunit CbiE [Alphaproteobacteria bacterium]